MMGYDPDFQDPPTKQCVGFRAKGEPDPPVKLWTLVFIANLPFPTFMGLLVTGGQGLPGLALGVALLYTAGRRACRRHPWAVRTVSHGGVVVAAAQACPILQMVAGLVAVAVAGSLTGMGTRAQPGHSPRGQAGALIATIITGLLLIACAALVGLVFRAVARLVSMSRSGVDDGWIRSGDPEDRTARGFQR